MGLEIGKSHFTQDDEKRFAACLKNNLEALEMLLNTDGFGQGGITLGAELEVYIVDQQGRPCGVNQAIQQQMNDSQLTLELNQYNLEYNFSPVSLAGRPFQAMQQEMDKSLLKMNRLAANYDARIVPIGILPTLRREDFGPEHISPTARYKALMEQLKKRRNGAFHIEIEGNPTLTLDMEDVSMEGANTSLQIHLRVPPDQFAATYNAVQMATPLVLGLAANSPFFLGHQLWQETRIPLFKQSIDCRRRGGDWLHPARVQFGHGWLREGALELFRETVALYPPLLPICGKNNALMELKSGLVPKLEELRLHQSTVWLWNRPVYDPLDGGHLRIEMRALPAGPTAQDMMANTALLVGLAKAMSENMETLLPAMPFQYAEYNFYRAAQYGLETELAWPSKNHDGLEERPLTDIILEWLPAAHDALCDYGIADDEVKQLLDVIKTRIQGRINGAIWQQAMSKQLASAGCSPQHQAQQMLARYLREIDAGRPVAEWSLDL